MNAPFPYPGSKRILAPILWQAFGNPKCFIEPFAGSCATLLARPQSHFSSSHATRIEIVNDADCLLSNVWRAIQSDPEAVARVCDWPVNEIDLTARHHYLVDHKAELRQKLLSDPNYYDARMAGWWIWGISQWIGNGWCKEGKVYLQIPHLFSTKGIHQTKFRVPHKIPGGFSGSKGGRFGSGVHQAYFARHPESLFASFQALSDRLRYVKVCSGDFERVLSDCVIGEKPMTAILLDPPYLGTESVYAERKEAVAQRALEWAKEQWEHPLLRIAFCSFDDGQLDIPTSWRKVSWKAAPGYRIHNTSNFTETVWLSPACLISEQEANPQLSLFQEESEEQGA